MIDRSTREPPPAAALRVSPNAVLESIDSGDFLAGVMRAGVATALRRRGTTMIAACARRSLPRSCGDLPRAAAGTCQGWLQGLDKGLQTLVRGVPR